MRSRLLFEAVGALLVSAAARAEPARLAGVVIAGDDRAALFAAGTGEPCLTLHEGDHLGAERIIAIRTNTVLLDGPDGNRVATLQNDPAARAALLRALPPPRPHVDPYVRERDTETDQ